MANKEKLMQEIFNTLHYLLAGAITGRLLMGIDPSFQALPCWRWLLPILMVICVVSGIVSKHLMRKHFLDIIFETDQGKGDL
jgi:hypothetical protein